MKIHSLLFALLLLGLFILRAPATTYYVDANCTNPVSPYTDWSIAATNIQDAVDLTTAGDLVMVTNGVYNPAGRVMAGGTNCVVVTNSIMMESVNGPTVTTIQAYPAPWVTNGAKRCVYLGNGATISGFTLMNGAANGNAGGGIYCQSGSPIISNCVLTCNSAKFGGGGISGTYDNCLISSNTAINSGGGVDLNFPTTMNNCLVLSNSGGGGGGISCEPSFIISVSNCIIAYNSAGTGGGAYAGSYYNCVISSNTASGNGGGVYLFEQPVSTLNNCLITDNYAISFGGGVYSEGGILNNCTIAGNTADRGGGIDDGLLGATFLTNCIIYYNSVTGNQGTNILNTTNVFNCCTTPTNGLGANNIINSPGFVNIDGSDFHLAPWSSCIDAGTNAVAVGSTDLDGNPRVVNNTVDIGAYEYQYPPFTNIVHYVALKNTNAAAPFTNWLTAATNIQAAIDASSPGDLVLVSNGVYNIGGRAVYGLATNRVVVDLPITVQSLSGAALTIIQAAPAFPGRCAYLTNGATIIGFTLTNGNLNASDFLTNENGGGAWCESPAATLINCSFAANRSPNCGGGVYSGTLVNCILSNNVASIGGGSCSSIVINSILTNNIAFTYGGGACFGVLSNCSLLGNFATSGFRPAGGGACSNILYDCILSSNWSPNGGGAYSCILSNCTLTGNMATNSGGGATYGSLVNCTLAGNTALKGGGAASNALLNCVLSSNFGTNNGGGTFYAIPTNCTFLGNSTAGNGGGLFGGTVNNCFFLSNSATSFGGGACFGTAFNCIFTNNSAYGGGGMASNMANNCLVISNRANGGGGVFGGTLNYCSINNNIATGSGGGAEVAALNFCNLFNNSVSLIGGIGGGDFGGTLISCTLSNNFSTSEGGGAGMDALTDCLIIKNKAGSRNNGQGSGVYQANITNCTVVFNLGLSAVTSGNIINCIIYYNLATNWSGNGSGMYYCCTYPFPTGPNSPGCITNAPLFVDTNGDFHLQSNSPCINSGNHVFVSITNDFDGNPRIVSGNVDMGAYEYQTPGSVISYAFLQQYGLPTDGSVDYANLNGTPYNVYQDWIAGLNPTNPASTFMLSVMPISSPPTNFVKGVTVSWAGTTNIYYNLQRSTNLSAQPAFSTIQPNIIGNNGTMSYKDTSATNSTPYFYRVNVVGP